jgi:uncharacterized membrane protein YbhN (UPF0104 family)
MIKKAPENSSHLFRMKKRSLIQVAVLALALAILLPQVKQFAGSWHHLTASDPFWILIGLVAMLMTILFAALVYVVLVPVQLPFKRTALIQLATYFTNRLLPSGLGGVGFNALYLVKQAKVSRTEAAVYATANNLIGFLAFSICIGLSTFFADSQIETNVPLKQIFIGLGALAIVITVVALTFRQVQRKLLDFIGHLFGVLLTIIRHPKRLMTALIFSMSITISYLAVLWASTKAVGIELSIVDLFIAFVAGNTALTISPTPGGIGAVEAAITGVIVSASISPSLALASVVLFRIISYWIPIVPGYIAFRTATKKKYV